MIKIDLPAKFKGETVVLLAMDFDGVDVFASALARVAQDDQGSVQLIDSGTIHKFVAADGDAEVKLLPKCVTWYFSKEKTAEVTEKLNSMATTRLACHHYVDISRPVGTLVLSLDEYVQPRK